MTHYTLPPKNQEVDSPRFAEEHDLSTSHFLPDSMIVGRVSIIRRSFRAPSHPRLSCAPDLAFQRTPKNLVEVVDSRPFLDSRRYRAARRGNARWVRPFSSACFQEPRREVTVRVLLGAEKGAETAPGGASAP